jgi:hypothetical protein
MVLYMTKSYLVSLSRVISKQGLFSYVSLKSVSDLDLAPYRRNLINVSRDGAFFVSHTL